MKNFKKTASFFGLIFIFAIVLTLILRIVIYNLYPLKYEEYIFKSSDAYRQNPYFVMALIKAESNFNTSAHSDVAGGLMQITDDTAMWICDKMGINFTPNLIENPEINIKMGCYYLEYLANLYSDNDVVLACYNAGMGNVAKWLSDEKFSSDGKTLDYIPFPETRNYIKRVNRYKSVYEKLYAIDNK